MDEINLKLTQNHEQLHQNDTNEESVDDHVPETLFPRLLASVSGERHGMLKGKLTPPDSTLDTNTNIS